MEKKFLLLLLLIMMALLSQCVENSGSTIEDKENFNAEKDAMRLSYAILDTNTEFIIEIICSISNAQRQELAVEVMEFSRKNVVKDGSTFFDKNINDIIAALMKIPLDFDVDQMHIASKKHNSLAMLEILASRTNDQIKNLDAAYEAQFMNTLEKDITSGSNNTSKRLLVGLLHGFRGTKKKNEENLTDETHGTKKKDKENLTDETHGTKKKDKEYSTAKLIEKAKEFVESGKKVEEQQFQELFTQLSVEKLRLFFGFYKDEAIQYHRTNKTYKEKSEKSGHYDIEQAIKDKFIGDYEICYLELTKYIRNSADYFASKLDKALNGFHGLHLTMSYNYDDIIRTLVSRSEIDLADIKKSYWKRYGMSLEEKIDQKVSDGLFKKALLALVKGNKKATNSNEKEVEQEQTSEEAQQMAETRDVTPSFVDPNPNIKGEHPSMT